MNDALKLLHSILVVKWQENEATPSPCQSSMPTTVNHHPKRFAMAQVDIVAICVCVARACVLVGSTGGDEICTRVLEQMQKIREREKENAKKRTEEKHLNENEMPSHGGKRGWKGRATDVLRCIIHLRFM